MEELFKNENMERLFREKEFVIANKIYNGEMKLCELFDSFRGFEYNVKIKVNKKIIMLYPYESHGLEVKYYRNYFVKSFRIESVTEVKKCLFDEPLFDEGEVLDDETIVIDLVKSHIGKDDN